MWKIYQDKTVQNDGHGNCFAACIASMMDLYLREVPNLFPNKDPNFHTVWDKFLEERGLRLHLVFPKEGRDPPRGYSLATILTDRVYPSTHPSAGLNIFHAVVMFDGELFHDPYPPGSVIRKILHYEILVPLSYKDEFDD